MGPSWEAYEVDWSAIGDFMKCLVNPHRVGATACRLMTKCTNACLTSPAPGICVAVCIATIGPACVYGVVDCAISSF